MPKELPRRRLRPAWPTSFDLLRVVAGAFVLRDPQRPPILKGKQVQRFLSGRADELSEERQLDIIRMLATRFLLEDPLVVALHAPTETQLAELLGVTPDRLREQYEADSRVRELVDQARDVGPAVRNAAVLLCAHLAAWDEFAHQHCPPRGHQRRWLIGQLRIAVVELGVFSGYMSFKLGQPPTEQRPSWSHREADDRFVRSLVRDSGLTREALVERIAGGSADGAARLRTTVDRWCDKGRRPTDDHLGWLAHALDPKEGPTLRQRLRRHFALREVVKALRVAVGDEDALDMVDAFSRIAAATHQRLARTRVQGGAMHAAICDMVLGDWMRGAPSPSILAHLLEVERVPAWRVTLRAMRLAARRACHDFYPHFSYPRAVLMTELTDATKSDLFAAGTPDPTP